jgi:hypothetical protein
MTRPAYASRYGRRVAGRWSVRFRLYDYRLLAPKEAQYPC